MCKILFNKNQNYKATEIAQAVYDITPGRYANVDSAIAAVNIFIRKNGITPVNGQRQNKVYSGLDCQKVLEHFAPARKQLEIKITEPAKNITIKASEAAKYTISADSIKSGKFDFSSYSKADLLRLKNDLDEALKNAAPDWDTMKPGDHFIFKGIEWVCLDPDYSEGDEKGVFAIAAQLDPEEVPFAKEDTDHDIQDYTYSEVREYLLNKYDELLKYDTIPHRCDLRMDNGDEPFPAVYDNVFILSIFEYLQYVNYVPRYDNCHRLRSAYRGNSLHTWVVSTSGNVYLGSYAVSALQCAPACIIRKSNNPRPTHRSQEN